VGNPRAGTKQRLWPARCRWPGSASSVSRTRIRRQLEDRCAPSHISQQLRRPLGGVTRLVRLLVL
jgi:hypothetical protein